jgi:hypothetical protein
VQLCRPIENVPSYQKGVYYVSIMIFNKLPASTAELLKPKQHLILNLKRFLIIEFFYSIKEYSNYYHKINIDDCSIRKG